MSASPPPAWQQVRVEGQSPSYLLRHLYGYTKKAYLKKWDAPADLRRHFAREGEALQALSLARPPTDAAQVRVGLVGDLIWVPQASAEIPSDALLAHLNSHDLLFGNLETTISAKHAVPSFLPLRTKFNSSRALLEAFRRADGRNSFSAVSLANNHALDFGDEGLRETMRTLQTLQVPWSGARAERESAPSYVAINANGIRFGFYAATYGVNRDAHLRSRCGINFVPGLAFETPTAPLDLRAIEGALDDMQRDGVEFRIVSLHWGYEYELYPDPRQLQVARAIAAMGASLIMGHHPHVPQPSEIIVQPDGRRTLVAYSLGNFLSNMFSFTLQTGLVRSICVFRDPHTGRVDWTAPDLRFTHSRRRRHEIAGHRLVLMEEHLADARGRRDEAEYARLRHHVGIAP